MPGRVPKFVMVNKSMVKHYRQHLIEFAYPDSWALQPPETDQLPQEIAVESPEGCLWVVHVFAATREPQTLLDEFMKTLKENYQDLEYETTDSAVQPSPILAVQADFFCLDFLITACVQVFVKPPFTLLVLQQAENRLYDQSRLVFDAITTSLLGDDAVTDRSV